MLVKALNSIVGRVPEVLLSGSELIFVNGLPDDFDIDDATDDTLAGSGAIESMFAAPALPLGVSLDVGNGLVVYDGAGAAIETTATTFTIRRTGSGITIRYTIPAIIIRSVAPPTNLQATVTAPRTVRLTWTGSPGADSHRVYRSADGVSFVLIADFGPGEQYDDTNLTAWDTYYWRVSGVLSGVEGDPSSVVSETAEGPAILSNVRLSNVTSTAVRVRVDTDQVLGTAYSVITTSPTHPTAAQIIAGQDHTGASLPAGRVLSVAASTTTLTFDHSNLDEGNIYYAHLTQRIAAYDAVVVTSDQFSTETFQWYDASMNLYTPSALIAGLPDPLPGDRYRQAGAITPPGVATIQFGDYGYRSAVTWLGTPQEIVVPMEHYQLSTDTTTPYSIRIQPAT